MSDRSNCCWHRYGSLSRAECCKHYSMRDFLNDTESFVWPDGPNTNMLHYSFTANQGQRELLQYERSLVDPWFHNVPKSEAANVTQWRVKDDSRQAMKFKHSFAVKQVRRPSGRKLNPKDGDEIKALTNLRHPHISALMATFVADGFRYMLTFPSGCCDLRDFMYSISEKLKSRESHDIILGDTEDEKKVREPYGWPLRMPVKEQRLMLRKYFLCLSEALAHLHSDEILTRHKDIKPSNLIVDLYGNIVITDFDHSKKFTIDNKMMTTDGPYRSGTAKYRPTEVQLDQHQPRDKRSDVWSLGCVFLEMVTLTLGKTLDECREVCSHPLPLPGGRRNSVYCENADGITSWIQKLEDIEPCYRLELKETTLPTIAKMLSPGVEERPFSNELWLHFDFSGQGQCPDCHPQNRNKWVAPKEQQARRLEHQSRLLIEQAEEKKKEYEKLQEEAEQKSQEAQEKRSSISSMATFLSKSKPPRPGSPLQTRYYSEPQSHRLSSSSNKFAAQNPLGQSPPFKKGLGHAREKDQNETNAHQQANDWKMASYVSEPHSILSGAPTNDPNVQQYSGTPRMSPPPERVPSSPRKPGSPQSLALVHRTMNSRSSTFDTTTGGRQLSFPSLNTYVIAWAQNLGLNLVKFSSVDNNFKCHFSIPKESNRFSIQVGGSPINVLDLRTLEDPDVPKRVKEARKYGIFLVDMPSVKEEDKLSSEERLPSLFDHEKEVSIACSRQQELAQLV